MDVDESLLSNLSDALKNPKNYAGIWYVLHILSKDATNDDKKKIFKYVLEKVVDELRCGDCRNHAKKYLKEHNIDDYRKVIDKNGNDVGFFKYMWIFHNFVNARLKKPILNWETAYRMYYGNTEDFFCSSDCDQSKKISESEKNIEKKSETEKKIQKKYVAKGFNHNRQLKIKSKSDEAI